MFGLPAKTAGAGWQIREYVGVTGNLAGGETHFFTEPSYRGRAVIVNRNVGKIAAGFWIMRTILRESYETVWPAQSMTWKSKLEQVRPDSAFCSSEMSMGRMVKPCAFMRAAVYGKDAGKIT